MTNANSDLSVLRNQSQNDDDIDLRQVFGALSRRWTWLAKGSAIGLLLSGLHLLVTKPVYQGEFQIVISRETPQSGAAALISQNPGLAALAGLGGAAGDDSIATEVEILNSPSVLKPVFDAVKAQKPDSAASAMRSCRD